MTEPPGAPHDGFFKATFGRQAIARDFIAHYLPAALTQHMDLVHLTVDQEGYVADTLKEYFSDVVVTVPLTGGDTAEVYILFEHKSSSDRLARLQVLRYMVAKWDTLEKAGELPAIDGRRYLPLIVPVVVYHGPEPWRHGNRFADLFQPPDPAFYAYLPDFAHVLHDIGHIDEERLRATAGLYIIQWLLKHIFDDDLPAKLPELVQMLLNLSDPEWRDALLPSILKYLLRAGKSTVNDVQRTAAQLPRGESIMQTAAEELRQQGIQQGMQQGMQQGEALALLRQMERKFGNLSAATREKIENADADVLLHWLDRILTAETPEEVFH